MAKQVFINLPVSDLKRSTAFYEALGFKKNDDFSDENATALSWSDSIVLMILDKEFYKSFIKDKKIIDSESTSGVLLALSLDSKEAVQKFADTAKANGGDYYTAGPEMSEELMFGYEVSDPDGHVWEPVWMNTEFNPKDAK